MTVCPAGQRPWSARGRVVPKSRRACQVECVGLTDQDRAWSEQNTVLTLGRMRRQHDRDVRRGIERLVDEFEGVGRCGFLTSHAGRGLAIPFPGCTTILPSGKEGMVIDGDEAAGAYWLPLGGRLRRYDKHWRILDERRASPPQLEADRDGLCLMWTGEEGYDLEVVVWQLTDASLITEVPAHDAYFLWSSHAQHREPAELYEALVRGRVYERRNAWPHGWRIGSENEAYPLYQVFTGLYRVTGRELYDALRLQITASVIARQSPDGAWRHGAWTQGMEVHYRLHCSGMHLLMDYLDETGDEGARDALKKAADFVRSQAEQTDLGVWFPHDELEKSREAMSQMPLPWVAAQSLGSRASNTLTLNTHVDTTIALRRADRMLGEARWRGEIESAEKALHRLLALRPAETWYRVLFSALALTLLPRPQSRSLGLMRRTVRYLARSYILPNWSRIKARRPRLVMPGGFVDRAVSIGKLADPYHSINLMDLARYAQLRPSAIVARTLDDGIRFLGQSRLHHHWAETPAKAYALAFTAEALCRRCLTSPDESLRALLAEIIILIERAGVGLPPAVLGPSAEAVPTAKQLPTLVTGDPALKLVNLSRGGAGEYLCINVGEDCRDLPAGSGLEWRVRGPRSAQTGRCRESAPPDRIPAKGWAVARVPSNH